jgi:hypothetical protein
LKEKKMYHRDLMFLLAGLSGGLMWGLAARVPFQYAGVFFALIGLVCFSWAGLTMHAPDVGQAGQ